MADLILYGTVGASFWDEDHFTPADVRAYLDQARGPITVRLNSGGGIATDGQAIYSMLRSYAAAGKGKVTIIVEGCAASAASLIFMAATEGVMTQGSWILLHDPATPWTDGRGTPDDHAKAAALLDTIGDAYAEIYAVRAGLSQEEARNLMRAETVLVGEAAVQMGFADRVDTFADPMPVAAFDYRIYATAPKAAKQAAERLGTFQGKPAVLAMIAEAPANQRRRP